MIRNLSWKSVFTLIDSFGYWALIFVIFLLIIFLCMMSQLQYLHTDFYCTEYLRCWSLYSYKLVLFLSLFISPKIMLNTSSIFPSKNILINLSIGSYLNEDFLQFLIFLYLFHFDSIKTCKHFFVRKQKVSPHLKTIHNFNTDFNYNINFKNSEKRHKNRRHLRSTAMCIFTWGHNLWPQVFIFFFRCLRTKFSYF